MRTAAAAASLALVVALNPAYGPAVASATPAPAPTASSTAQAPGQMVVCWKGLGRKTPVYSRGGGWEAADGSSAGSAISRPGPGKESPSSRGNSCERIKTTDETKFWASFSVGRGYKFRSAAVRVIGDATGKVRGRGNHVAYAGTIKSGQKVRIDIRFGKGR